MHEDLCERDQILDLVEDLQFAAARATLSTDSLWNGSVSNVAAANHSGANGSVQQYSLQSTTALDPMETRRPT